MRLPAYQHDEIHRNLYRLYGDDLCKSAGLGYGESNPLSPPKEKTNTLIQIVNKDSFETAIFVRQQFRYSVAVLNMASEFVPGGGWRGDGNAQEECLFRQSTLALSLESEHHLYYPIPKGAGIYSPHVFIWAKPDETPQHPDFPKAYLWTSVISVAGVRDPFVDRQTGLMSKADTEDTLRNIRTIFRIAALHNHQAIILGALGCGCFHCPPQHVASLFKQVIEEPEFKGRFEALYFAILGDNLKSKHLREVFSNTLLGKPYQGDVHPVIKKPEAKPFVFHSEDFPPLGAKRR